MYARGWWFAVLLLAACHFEVAGADVPLQPTETSAGPPASELAAGPADLSSADAALEGASTPDAAMPPHAVGYPCDPATYPCGSGLTCMESIGGGKHGITFPGGYCTVSCDSVACPAGSDCQVVGGMRLCLATCPPASCRATYGCCSNSGPNVCAPAGTCD
jgi:hypothetical protein